jgi:hypothetical protein
VLDPEGKQFAVYNRYGEVTFKEPGDPTEVSFENPMQGFLAVRIFPDNPRLKQIGVRYVLLIGDKQVPVDEKRLRLVYHSPSGRFTIYEFR